MNPLATDTLDDYAFTITAHYLTGDRELGPYTAEAVEEKITSGVYASGRFRSITDAREAAIDMINEAIENGIASFEYDNARFSFDLAIAY